MDKKNRNWIRWCRHKFLLIFFLAAYLLVVNSYTQQIEKEYREDKDKIKVGMSTVMSGPTQSLGNDMKMGIETYFKRINSKKEIIFKKTETITITDRNGEKKPVDRHIIYSKTVQLIALDDGYLPELAEANTVKLVDEYNVLAIIGNGGTATVNAALDVAKKKKILIFAPHTGAGSLRITPPDRYVIHYRPSYAQEIDAMIKALKDYTNIRPYEIAFFTQDDPYGNEGYDGAVNSLKTHYSFTNIDILAHGRYERNTVDVNEGVMKILDAKIPPKAIIIVGTPAPCAKFIRTISPVLPQTIFLSISIGSEKLAKLLEDKCERVIVTQVVPHYESNLPVCRDYRNYLKKNFPDSEPGFVSLEGYIAAKIFCEGLKDAYARGKLTREGIIDAIERINKLDVGLGTRINYSSRSHQAINKVWPTRVIGDKLVSFEWKNLPDLLSSDK